MEILDRYIHTNLYTPVLLTSFRGDKTSDILYKLTHIIIESLIILFFVGITEFVFLKYFGARFISIDINKVKIALLTKIKNYIGNK